MWGLSGPSCLVAVRIPNRGTSRLASLRTFALGLAAVSAAVPLASDCLGQTAEAIRDLGYYTVAAPSEASSTVRGVSGNGSVVVGTATYWLPDGLGTRWRPFMWSAATGFRLLDGSQGVAVSADGAVAVGSYAGSGVSYGCRWSLPATSLTPMSMVPDAISADGSTVLTGGGTQTGATVVRITSEGAWRIDSTAYLIAARAISGDGNVAVGWRQGYSGYRRSFRWTPSAGAQSLVPPIGYEWNNEANAVSASGALTAGFASSGSTIRACTWDTSGTPTLLPQPVEFSQSTAEHMSGSGAVIAGWGLRAGVYVPVVWTASYGMRELASVLLASGISLTGWTLESVKGVSADGTAIIGTGLHDGLPRSFLISGFAVPPDIDSDGIPDTIDNCVGITNDSQADCDHDGIGDACAIAAGAPDVNQNGVPDVCDCIGDIFQDRRVDGGDLGVLLSYWGVVSGSAASRACDLNGDGRVDGFDLGALLANWGECSQ